MTPPGWFKHRDINLDGLKKKRERMAKTELQFVQNDRALQTKPLAYSLHQNNYQRITILLSLFGLLFYREDELVDETDSPFRHH